MRHTRKEGNEEREYENSRVDERTYIRIGFKKNHTHSLCSFRSSNGKRRLSSFIEQIHRDAKRDEDRSDSNIIRTCEEEEEVKQTKQTKQTNTHGKNQWVREWWRENREERERREEHEKTSRWERCKRDKREKRTKKKARREEE
jgi:hypothetical protein